MESARKFLVIAVVSLVPVPFAYLLLRTPETSSLETLSDPIVWLLVASLIVAMSVGFWIGRREN